MIAIFNGFVAGWCLRAALEANSTGWAIALTIASAINIVAALGGIYAFKRVPA